MAHQRQGAEAQRELNRQRVGFVIVALFASWVFGTPPTYVGIKPGVLKSEGGNVFRDSDVEARPAFVQAKSCRAGAFSCVSRLVPVVLIAANP